MTTKTATDEWSGNLKDGFAITRSKLKTTVLCPGITKEKLNQQAEEAAQNCPVSKALAGAEISVEAVLTDERGKLGV
jgi:organic hydroperoxide reductase OsmC/OhrA